MNEIKLATAEIIDAYPTKIYIEILPEMEKVNNDLKKILLDKRLKDTSWTNASKIKSNYGGWRSGDDLWRWSDNAVGYLRNRVMSTFKSFLSRTGSYQVSKNFKFETFAWANVNENGAYNAPHIHSGYQFSGVYYVTAPKLSKECHPFNGQISFEDPRPGAAMAPLEGFNWGKHTNVLPKESMLVLFPSWLMHHVHPYYGEEPRISIPFNIKLRI
jgi:uncharacterized protein (TIGR02466 family)